RASPEAWSDPKVPMPTTGIRPAGIGRRETRQASETVADGGNFGGVAWTMDLGISPTRSIPGQANPKLRHLTTIASAKRKPGRPCEPFRRINCRCPQTPGDLTTATAKQFKDMKKFPPLPALLSLSLCLCSLAYADDAFNGLSMGLGGLYRTSNAQSRSISAENPSGA